MNIREAFVAQGEACENLGSPFMRRLLTLIGARLSEDTAVGRKILSWPGDFTAKGDAVALRLAGGLHQLVLAGQAPDIKSVYPPNTCDDAALWEVINATLTTHEAALLAALTSPPQTNEVRRSAVLRPGLGVIASETDLPIVLSEIGASAGLNLGLDAYQIKTPAFSLGPSAPVLTLTPEWQGATPPLNPINITERLGCDLRRVDLSDPQAQLRLLSYLWPDQPERMSNTRAALKAASAKVYEEHAINFLTRRLMEPREGAVHVIMHSIAWQYLSAADQAEGNAIIEAAGRAAHRGAPLARLSMEADDQTPGAAVTLQMWPGGEIRQLARVDFHGRWVHWSGL